MCSASETSTTDLLEVLAMKWLLDLAQVVDAQREQRDGRHEVVAGNSEAVCRALGLQRVEPLLFWRGGRVALHDVVETLTTDSPFGFLTVARGSRASEERHELEHLLATCMLRGDTLLDSEVPLVLVRRLLVLEIEDQDGAVTADPSGLCAEVLEPVLDVVRERCEAGLAGPGNDETGEGRTPQQEVDRQRKNLKPLFALAWFGEPELLGQKLVGEIGKCALDRAMRSSDPAAMTKRIREARARGADDETVRAILNGIEPDCEDDSDEVERGVEENGESKSEVERGRVLVPVGLTASIVEQMGMTAHKCPQRYTSFETTACKRCLLGKRCPSKARSVVTREVGDWLVGFAEGAGEILRRHRTAERFRIWLEPVEPGCPGRGLKRTFASGHAYRGPPRNTKAGPVPMIPISKSSKPSPSVSPKPVTKSPTFPHPHSSSSS